MKLPKIRLRRADVERALIACSAVLVLLLSVKSGRNSEPYEEPLEDIPQVSVSASKSEDLCQTVVYYEDGDGYLVPVQREVARQEGIAKATLELWCESAQRHGRRAAGAYSRRAGGDDVRPGYIGRSCACGHERGVRWTPATSSRRKTCAPPSCGH